MKELLKKLKNNTSNHLEYLFGVLLVMLITSAFLFIGTHYVKNINKQNKIFVNEKATLLHSSISTFLLMDLNPDRISSAIDNIAKNNASLRNLYVIAEYDDVGEQRYDVVGTLNRYEVGMGLYKPTGLTETLMGYSVAGSDVAMKSYASGTLNILKTVSLIRNDNNEPVRVYIVSDIVYPVAVFTESKSLKSILIISILILFVLVLFLIKYLLYVSNKNHHSEKNKERNNLILFAFREVRTAIKSMGDRLEKVKDTERLSIDGSREISGIRNETKDLNSLISNIVDTHNLEEDKMVFHYSIINPSEILEDICRNMNNEAKEKGLKLSCLSSELPNIKVDRIRFKQIVQNLVHNAIKYTDRGGVTISSRQVEAGKFLEIRVSDTGIGINQEKQKQLFSKFFRENNEDIKGVKSAGLGLYLSSELAQKMDGSISFESKEGVGSDFVLKFKIKK